MDLNGGDRHPQAEDINSPPLLGTYFNHVGWWKKMWGEMVFSPSYDNPTLDLCGVHHTALRAKRTKFSIFSTQHTFVWFLSPYG